MRALVFFKHKSVKEYWSSKNYTHNKVIIEYSENDNSDDIEMKADFSVMDIIDLLYPEKNGSGYNVCYQYEIYKIDLNPYLKRQKKKN